MGKQKDFEYSLTCGSPSSARSEPEPAILLIGGAEGGKSGEDAATKWFLEKARGGNYLAIRTGGVGKQASFISRNYRDYVHSAAELSIDSREAANSREVEDYIREADALFIAGGDQNLYQELWEGTRTEDAINYLINDKKAPVAGTSAGMAILGSYYYAPDHQGIISSEILDDPFHFNTQTIHKSDFIQVPFLSNVITDTHLDRINKRNPETRYGRILGLLARVIAADKNSLDNHAIGLEEGAFVAIDKTGIAKVFGNGTHRGQDAYFLSPNGALPEQMEPGWPLVWDNGGKAVKVYKIAGTPEGTGEFNLNDWATASGGHWEYWYTLGGKSGLRKKSS
ncbi:cyanophycinase [Leptothoe kymatousa]|uniref:Cyanophycinase n=1 Tax=Leptothoe kymatousa TAU-MAC 1615 TaxID=2364775 RepID=A0ABS5Y897_9CYAN|nr:cyanophycinase [Leptothoe kymatousa]MBT9313165.1 cyanophycinase [Leptothoe kymatousa TAU-MAC 1615]